jgi:hypothetical protein
MILFCPSVGKICPEQAENAVLPVIYYICNYASIIDFFSSCRKGQRALSGGSKGR